VVIVVHTGYWLGNPKKGDYLEDNIEMNIQEM
jgi:hypothetical protein